MRQQSSEYFACEIDPGLLDALRGKRIFLSGGTGFFGKWLLQSFLFLSKTYELNATITILSRNPVRFLDVCPEFKRRSELRFIQGDIRKFTFPSEKYDFIIHAATEASTALDQEDPAEMRSVIVDGTQRMLDFSLQAGAERFMMTSSGAVYGPQPVDLNQVPETFIGSPSTAYGQGKLDAEGMCVAAGNKYGFTVLLPRCFAFVGPYLDLDIHYAIGNFIRDCLKERPVTVKGDGSPLRSYLYAADLAEWLWTILLRGSHARVYNVGSDQVVSIKDLACMVRDLSGAKSQVVILKTALAGVPPARYVPSIERARSELKLRVRCPLEKAIKMTLEWHRNRDTLDFPVT